MATAIATDSRDVLLELHSLLKDLDPVHWSAELRDSLAARLAVLRERAHLLLDELKVAASAWTAAFAEPVGRLVETLDGAPTAADDKRTWMAFRATIASEYAALAKAAEAFDVHVPALRPTNYWRNVFHVLNAVWVLTVVEYVLTTDTRLIGVAVFGAVWAWSMEIGRRVSPRINEFLMGVFSKVAHPHETHRVNSATWYASAFILLATLFPLHIGVTALAVLGLGDPAAAIIGRRWGRHRFANGRSVEGSLAFVAFGMGAGVLALSLWYAELGWTTILALSFVVSVVGSMAELWTRRIDDNFAIPIAGAIGGQLLMWTGLL
jgi:dolichol kinase